MYRLCVGIRMQDPLKQGLKHKASLICLWFECHSNARSIKTRIETCDCRGGGLKMTYSNARSIKTRIETPSVLNRCLPRLIIRMQDPLKQGLKHEDAFVIRDIRHTDSNARSIKTRIETQTN